MEADNVAHERLSGIDIINAVDNKIKKIRTRSLDISFNELLDMYLNEELIINPDFQRLFRWDEKKQSQFIESLILEIPMPPIFVIEVEEGKYELIDGLQRISSYLHFRGQYPNLGYLKLQQCDIVKELNDMTYEDLPPAIKIKMKRNFSRVEIIRRESDPRLRYYIFKRLNTGGEKLEDQEIRNCTIHLLDDRFNKLIIELSINDDFLNTTKFLAKASKDKLFDKELVLRFFAIKNYRDKYIHDVGTFLTGYMEAVADPKINIEFDYINEKVQFEKTFKILNSILGEYAFSDTTRKGTPKKRVSPYYYEAFAIGIQKYLNNINPLDTETVRKIGTELSSIKNDENFRSIIMGGGKNTSRNLEARIRFVEDRLGALFE